jgi:hypothetical protein
MALWNLASITSGIREMIIPESRQISIGSGPAEIVLTKVMGGPGRFGPSRKKEAAARRFGNYELWVLNAAMIRTMLVDGRMRGDFCGLATGVITGAR